MEIKIKDQICSVVFENIAVDFKINEDASFVVESENRIINSPGEYEFNGLHSEFASLPGLDFQKIHLGTILTNSNKKVAFVSLEDKVDKNFMTMLANSDIFIARTTFIINNESIFAKLSPFYVVGIGGSDVDEKYKKLFSVDTNQGNKSLKIDEKVLNQDSDYITNFLLVK